MSTEFTYSINSDFSNGVATDRLTSEIRVSSIAVALDRIDTVGDDCIIIFKASLSGTEESTLNSVVAAHSGLALPSEVLKVRAYVDESTPQPVAEDGKQYVLPNIFPGEVILAFAGASDSVSGRMNGTLFNLSKTGQGDSTLNTTFSDGVYLAGGHVQWTGGSYGSWIDMDLVAPASTVKAPASPNTGNCNLVPTGLGFNIIIPAAGTGVYDLDKTIPVPANNEETDMPNGYWTHNEPWIGKGIVSPGVPGSSPYNLYDVPLTLAHICKVHCLTDVGTRDVLIPAIRPKWVFPEWEMKVTMHNEDANKTLKAAWDLMVARKRSN